MSARGHLTLVAFLSVAGWGCGSLTVSPDASLLDAAVHDAGAMAGGMRADEATVWTSDLEPHSLAELLTAAGVDLTGWYLMTASSISADGKVVIGSGMHGFRALGFIAWLP